MQTDTLIDQLAELAGQRNRNGLDTCFIDLFSDLLRPKALAVYRLDHQSSRPHWTISRRTAGIDKPSLVKSSSRPSMLQLPAHHACWLSGQVRTDDEQPALTLVPMGTSDDMHCLIEILSHEPLTEEQGRLVRSAQRFYRHLRNLIDENERDALTRLLNRKSFDESFLSTALLLRGGNPEEEQGEPEGSCRAPQLGKPRHWLAVIDIDFFKSINDSHGHLIGDEVLILVAQIMRSNFRAQDRLYRFGGEEFVVTLSAPSPAAATSAFERLRTTIANYRFPRVGHLTVSVGFTEILPTDTPGSAFERADEGVYYAKSHGRNRVIAHEGLIKTGEAVAAQLVSEMELF